VNEFCRRTVLQQKAFDKALSVTLPVFAFTDEIRERALAPIQPKPLLSSFAVSRPDILATIAESLAKQRTGRE
jgi:hypothetical protein